MPAASPRSKNEKSSTGSPEEKRRHDDDDSGGEDDATSNQGSKYKKLASGKRADQNRKAQRAFRQRKDKYIKDLELRSQELDIANSLIVQLKEENDRLNEIAKSFHSRVQELEAQMSQFTNHQQQQQQSNATDKRRNSGQQYKTTESPCDSNQQYYSTVRRGTPREQQADQSQQSFTQTGHMGPVYSQTKGLL